MIFILLTQIRRIVIPDLWRCANVQCRQKMNENMVNGRPWTLEEGKGGTDCDGHEKVRMDRHVKTRNETKIIRAATENKMEGKRPS